MAEQVICPQCGNIEPPYWKDQPLNPELRAYVDAYISPVKGFHLTLSDALDAWGEDFTEEDLL